MNALDTQRLDLDRAAARRQNDRIAAENLARHLEGSIVERVRGIVAKEAFVRVDQVHVGSRLEEDLDLDSMGRVALSLALDDEFSIVLDDREVKKFRTVQQCVDLVIAALTPRADEVRAEQRLVEAQLAGRA